MENVLTLIGNRAWAPLSADIVSLACGALEEAGATCADPDWLSPELACDIVYTGFSADVAEAAVRQYLRDAPVDIVAQSTSRRRKRLLISDMDSTMIEQECINEIADFAGLRDEVSAITEAAMRGDLDFGESLVQRAHMLQGLGVDVLYKAMNERVTEMPGSKALVQTMRANGAFTALVSGGFTYFTNLVAKELGFHEDQANTLEIIDDVITGRVVPPILDKYAKLAALESYIESQNLEVDDTLAVGDGANDIPMLQGAGLGIAFHAKPLVAASASAHVDHSDLTSLLYIQGYRDEEFAA